MSSLNPDWSRDLLAIEFQLDHVFCLQTHPRGHCRPDQHGVIPGDLGHRLGQFLQPAVVGELAVVDAWDRGGS